MSSLEVLEIFAVALRNLTRQRFRSFLTLIGIVIGIAAIVALISLGQGLNEAVQREFEVMGTNTLIITAGESLITSPFSKLEEEDPERIEKVRGVDFAAAIYNVVETIKHRNDATTAMIIGIEVEKQNELKKLGALELAEGRELSSAEKFGVIVGDGFAEDAFDSRLNLREKLEISGHNFRIIGITESSGQTFGALFDRAIVMNYETLKDINVVEELYPFRIIVKTISKDEVDEVKERIAYTLEKAHGEKDFAITTPASIADIAASVLGIIQLILVALASISLLVGGIGIMNTMFMVVLERTKEIGTMKAIGATNKRVLTIFLLEAGFIGMFGGIIGVLFGYGISFLVSLIASLAGTELPIIPDPTLIVGVLLFAIFVGIVSGLIPARRAALLDPVVALRHE